MEDNKNQFENANIMGNDIENTNIANDNVISNADMNSSEVHSGTEDAGNNTQYSYYQVPQGEMPVKNSKAKKKKKAKKPMTFGKVFATGVAFMLVTVLLNSAILYGVLNYFDFGKGSQNGKSIMVGTTLSTGTVGTSDVDVNGIRVNNTSDYTVADIAKLVKPSVVSITNTSIVNQKYNPFYGGSGQYQVQGAGSGIIIGMNEKELLIVTNNHVVEDSVGLSVQFINDSIIDTAYVKGTNTSNDIAIVGVPLEDIEEDTLSAIKIATLGNSDALEEGDQVVAIGNALGYGQSVTVGYISAKNRNITVDGNDMVVIQTDAAINGGNSGGALINMKGEVIGINVAKSSSSNLSSTSVEGMGYAIPISDATSIITKLMNIENKEKYSEEERGYLGITSITVDTQTAGDYNIPIGAYVRSVSENGPADKAGITAGSVIVAVDDYEISTADELVEELSYYKAGDTVKIKVYVPDGREYTEKDIEITLTSKQAVD
ncbi:MAG: trypsin-like peptidase domain-containing protein [Lachnospiraceae bacterium]|nr:trypsin-like peptidase domain-containing protein [Lachnospiraceae bacterium]